MNNNDKSTLIVNFEEKRKSRQVVIEWISSMFSALLCLVKTVAADSGCDGTFSAVVHLAGDLDEPPLSEMRLQLDTRRPLEKVPVTQHGFVPSTHQR